MNKQRAFTLLEMLIVIGIFSLVLEAIVGIFLSALSIQRKTLVSQELLDQISYVLEYMGKTLRMAKKDDIEIYKEERNCLTGEKVNYETPTSSSIRFRNYKNECQEFFLQGNQIMEKRETLTSSIVLPLTSPKVEVTSLKFKINGENQEDLFQPSVTIFLELKKRDKVVHKMRIQTTISQRDADVQY